MNDLARTVDGYFAVWNEPDPARRRDLISQTWSNDPSYIDPLMAADGADGIDAMVAGVQSQYPGCTFRLTGAIDSYQDRARFSWEMVAPDSETLLVAGLDIAVLASDGRLQSITGFIDHAPALAAAS